MKVIESISKWFISSLYAKLVERFCRNFKCSVKIKHIYIFWDRRYCHITTTAFETQHNKNMMWCRSWQQAYYLQQSISVPFLWPEFENEWTRTHGNQWCCAFENNSYIIFRAIACTPFVPAIWFLDASSSPEIILNLRDTWVLKRLQTTFTISVGRAGAKWKCRLLIRVRLSDERRYQRYITYIISYIEMHGGRWHIHLWITTTEDIRLSHLCLNHIPYFQFASILSTFTSTWMSAPQYNLIWKSVYAFGKKASVKSLFLGIA